MSVDFAYLVRKAAPTSILQDLDSVRLTAVVMADDGSMIASGTEGTIVSVAPGGSTYVVEFAEPVGTLATVEPHEIQLVEATEH